MQVQAVTDFHDPTPDAIWSTMLRQLERRPVPGVAHPAPRTRSAGCRLYSPYLADRVTSKTARANFGTELFDLASCLLLSCAVLHERIQAAGNDGAFLSFRSNMDPRQVLAHLDPVAAAMNARLADSPWKVVVRARVLQ
jgi:hypothetical protein